MKTFYDILGVARTDSPERIRAAYVALMKRCHPDAAGRCTDGPVPDVHAVNEAFATLKDPRKRERYDLELSLRAKKADAAGQGPHPRPHVPPRRHTNSLRPVAPPPPPPGRSSAARKMLLPVLIAVVGGAGLYALKEEQGLATQVTVQGAAVVPATATVFDDPQVLVVDVRDAVSDGQWIAAHGSADEAVRYSRHCFNQLVDFPNLRFFDRCVAFDLFWQGQLAGQDNAEAVQAYFSGPGAAQRHEQQLARLSPDAERREARLARLDRLTVSEIARSLRPPSTPLSIEPGLEHQDTP